IRSSWLGQKIPLSTCISPHHVFSSLCPLRSFLSFDFPQGAFIMAVNPPLNRKLRMGLVGGGQGAFIGRVHATAAILDNRAVLVAGALSADPAKAKASAPDYDIKPERAYGSYQEMVAAEAKLPATEKIDFVSVATPNHAHSYITKTS